MSRGSESRAWTRSPTANSFDIANALCQIWLNLSDAPKLAVPQRAAHVFPTGPAITHGLDGATTALLRCAGAVETVDDVANPRALNNWKPPPHQLNEASNSRPADKEPSLSTSRSGNAATLTNLPDAAPDRNLKKGC